MARKPVITSIKLLSVLLGCVVIALYLCSDVIRQANGRINASVNVQNKRTSNQPRLQTWTHRSSVPVCTSQERLNYIRRQYRRYNVTSQHSTLLVNDKKRLAYCYIEKCGSTTLKTFMTALNNRSAHTRIKSHIHAPHHLTRLGLRFLNTADVAAIADYRKFVVIRHPMDRLLSAYHDKLGGGFTRIKQKMPVKNGGEQTFRMLNKATVAFAYHPCSTTQQLSWLFYAYAACRGTPTEDDPLDDV